MQMSADYRSRRRHVSRMTDEKGDTWSPSGMSKVRSRPESLVADCSMHALQPTALVVSWCQQSGDGVYSVYIVSIATQLNSTSSGVELCRYKHPFRDELLCRTARFITSCLNCENAVVQFVSRHGVYFGRAARFSFWFECSTVQCPVRYAVTSSLQY